jgi:hypothetical protein
MRKESKIRIIKNNSDNDGSYTFLNEGDNVFSSKSQDRQISKEIEKREEAGKPKERDKKVSNKKDIGTYSKSLRFTKPSQRNHSSVYE